MKTGRGKAQIVLHPHGYGIDINAPSNYYRLVDVNIDKGQYIGIRDNKI